MKKIDSSRSFYPDIHNLVCQVVLMKKLAIVTNGGDAPGMNAAIRALTKLATWNGLKVIGFR